MTGRYNFKKHIGGVMKFLKRWRKKPEEPKIEDKGPSLEETDIKILDNLIDELFNIDEDRAVELENKSS